jgi:hypothetical protein
MDTTETRRAVPISPALARYLTPHDIIGPWRAVPFYSCPDCSEVFPNLLRRMSLLLSHFRPMPPYKLISASAALRKALNFSPPLAEDLSGSQGPTFSTLNDSVARARGCEGGPNGERERAVAFTSSRF